MNAEGWEEERLSGTLSSLFEGGGGERVERIRANLEQQNTRDQYTRARESPA